MHICGNRISFEGHQAISVLKVKVILKHKCWSAKYRSRLIVHYPNTQPCRTNPNGFLYHERLLCWLSGEHSVVTVPRFCFIVSGYYFGFVFCFYFYFQCFIFSLQAVVLSRWCVKQVENSGLVHKETIDLYKEEKEKN